MTIVELLVVIAVIAVLAALLLPALQAAREAGRRSQCGNNLKNVGLGLLLYHDAHKQFPCGGWGHFWVGVPERGTGPRQPGGWAYCTLPYVEEAALHDRGTGAIGQTATEEYSRRVQTPVPLFVCPSRRPASAWPISDSFAFARSPRPYGNVSVLARSDYAINAGTAHVLGIGGPTDLKQGEDETYWRNGPTTPKFSGISHFHCAASLKSINDGTSRTYLAGEKYVPSERTMDGTAFGDNASLYAGYSSDLYRFAGVIENLKVKLSPYGSPLQDFDRPDSLPPDYTRFGSAHPSGFGMAYCDGSVQFVTFDVSPEIHFRAGHRKDEGNPIESLQ